MKRSGPLRRGKGFRRPVPLPKPARQWEGPIPGPRVASDATQPTTMACEPILKDNPARSEWYRRLVASLPCCNCGIVLISQAAHGPTLGAGIKASDAETFPLCADQPGRQGCHSRYDQYQLCDADHRVKWAAFWAGDTRKKIKAMLTDGAFTQLLESMAPMKAADASASTHQTNER